MPSICAASTLSSTTRQLNRGDAGSAPRAARPESPGINPAGARGSSIVKVLPCPAPSLSATTAPPCSATSVLTSASPSPRPPSDRSDFLRSLGKQVEHPCHQFGRHPHAVIGDFQCQRIGAGGKRHRDPATGGRVLRRVVDQVRDDLHQAFVVAVDGARLVRQVERQQLVLAGDRKIDLLNRIMNDRVEQDRFLVQLDEAARDARHVEQVVDRQRHVGDLALR